MSDELSKKLAQVEDDLRSLREEKATKKRALDAAKTEYSELVAESEDTTEAHAKAMDARGAYGAIEDQINAATQTQVDLLKLLGDKEAVQRNEPVSANGSAQPMGWHTGELFAEEQTRQQLEFLATSKSRFGSLPLGEVLSRDSLAGGIGRDDMFAADVGVTDTMREGRYRGILPQLLRPLTLLSLIPVGTTDGNLVPYTQETGALTGAAEVAEGDVKPEAGITFEDADAPVRTIAAWMKIRKQVLSDFSALRSIIDARLRYLVQRRLEGQILAGNGSGSNLTGILETPGIGSVAYSSSVPLTESILSGITNIFLAEGVADGVVLHPADWQAALTEKAHFGGGAGAAGTAGSYEYRGGGPFGSTPQSIWGVPCVPAAAMPQGTGLVADFGLGLTLLIREGLNVLLSDSDQDDFIRNRVTMLAEMRAALPVWRPQVFQEIDLSA